MPSLLASYPASSLNHVSRPNEILNPLGPVTLYLPKSWTADPVRLAAAHVPEGTAFATKPALAAKMIERAVAASMPFAWVAADAVYGVGDIEQVLRRAGKPVLSLPKGAMCWA